MQRSCDGEDETATSATYGWVAVPPIASSQRLAKDSHHPQVEDEPPAGTTRRDLQLSAPRLLQTAAAGMLASLEIVAGTQPETSFLLCFHQFLHIPAVAG